MNKQCYKLYVFVGDIDNSLSVAARSFDPQAYLIDSTNYSNFLITTLDRDTTVYTCLGDLPKNLEIFFSICCAADEVFYNPPNKWSDGKTVDEFDPGNSIQGLTEGLLSLISNYTKVSGLHITEPEQPIQLVDKRKDNGPQLWVAGCSVSHGIGVSRNQRFGQLLADELNLQCSFLTRPGSAIDWASDQIIRSDIRSGDIVVFGLTHFARLTHVHNKKLILVTSRAYETFPELKKIIPQHNLLTENTFYHHLTAIDRCINFCNKVNAKLIMLGLLTAGDYNLLRHLINKKNFFQYPYKFVNRDIFSYQFEDLGSDGEHPGAKQHQLYKDFVLKHLN